MIAGEASGDMLAARLIAALQVHLPHAKFFGIGGPHMQAKGFVAQWPADTLAVNGYVDVLRRYRELSGIRKQFLHQLLDDPPDLFIGVDAPDFNLWLEAQLKAQGVTTIHFISPSIWAWRGGRIHKIKRSVDHILCLFPCEPEIYARHQVPASFVGHPLADEFPLEPDRQVARTKLNIAHDARVVALMPGSRQGEIRHMAATFIKTAKLLHARYPELIFLAPFASTHTREQFKQILLQEEAQDLPLECIQEHSHEVMTAADVILVASGTATLEAALLKRPMVIVYKLAPLSYWIMRKLAYLPYVGLPNILLRESIVPEFIQDAAQPEALADALEHWLNNPVAGQALVHRFNQLHLMLRQDTASKAAEVVLSCLGIKL